jgi:hypothetical protein
MFVANMEDVLEVYQRLYDEKRPVYLYGRTAGPVAGRSEGTDKDE